MSSPRPKVKCRKRGGRAWHREHFVDHPLYDSNDPRAFVRPGRHAAVKAWCKRCLDAFVQHIVSVEAQQVQRGERTAVREPHVIAEDPDVWDAADAGWNSCDPARCLVHLRDCELQPPDVRERARLQIEQQNQARRVPEDASGTALVVRPSSPPATDDVRAPPAVPPPSALPYYAVPPGVVVHAVTYVYPVEYAAVAVQMARDLPQPVPPWPMGFVAAMPLVLPHGLQGWQPAAAAHAVNMAAQAQGDESEELTSWGEELSRAQLEDPEFWEELARLCEAAVEE
ncbi:hypothetical protein PsYK624_147750 [Phanerochaete sordida]|uniref:Uncharacterized protein n=1 Tax=Phanerochaete sordida TaxID=48140 RepID=A0A9P3GP71_9APHY|nr:hypothetical protein PsYK624_147750 [Phanerochaete sordida]